MPVFIPQLVIEDELSGTPSQRVPLRYAVLVTGLPVKVFLRFLTNELWNAEHPYALLTSYELGAQRDRVCRPETFQKILNTLENDSFVEHLEALKKQWFVYSDELAEAYSKYIDLCADRENAMQTGMGLNWHPAISGYESQLIDCVDGFDPSRVTQRERRKLETQKKHAKWYREYLALKTQYPNHSLSQLCEFISRRFPPATKAGVRRVLTDLRKGPKR